MHKIAFTHLSLFFVGVLLCLDAEAAIREGSLRVETCISVDQETFNPTADGEKAGHHFSKFARQKGAWPVSVMVTFYGAQAESQLDERVPKNHVPRNGSQMPLDITSEEHNRLVLALGDELAETISTAYHMPTLNWGSYQCGITVEAFMPNDLRPELCPDKPGPSEDCIYVCTDTDCVRK